MLDSNEQNYPYAVRDALRGTRSAIDFESAMKRAFDIICASIGIVLGSPIMALISVMVWLDSPGNVIFVQKRIGLNGKIYKMLKFRKFPVRLKDNGLGLTTANDARLTRVGRFLEKAKLDELPQLWNILKGEMSMVGPRPESMKFSDLFQGKYTDLLLYKPGLFGPSQIHYRNENKFYPIEDDIETFYRNVLFKSKAEIDLAYYQKANAISDIEIVIKSILISVIGLLSIRDIINRYLNIILIDLCVIAAGWIIGHFLIFAGWPSGSDYRTMIYGFFTIPPLIVFALFLGGFYRRLPKYFSILDFARLVLIVSVGYPILILGIYGLTGNVSIYVSFAVFMILLAFLPIPRVVYHLRERVNRKNYDSGHDRILIYGVDKSAYGLANFIGDSKILGFLDDNPKIKGKYINSYPVLGCESDISAIYQRHSFGQIWLTFKPCREKLIRLHALCKSHDIDLYILRDIKPIKQLFEKTL